MNASKYSNEEILFQAGLRLNNSLGDVKVLARAVTVPFGGYGNIGHAHDVDGWRADLMLEPEVFARHLLDCRSAGATLLGGCCGTEPRHLEALARGSGQAR